MRAATSAIGKEAERKAREEETRLLYVGVTRARDYLVLAPPKKGEAWLELLDVGGAIDHVQLPKAAGDPLKAGDSSFAAEALSISAKDAFPWSGPSPAFVAQSARCDRPSAAATEAERRRDRGATSR